MRPIRKAEGGRERTSLVICFYIGNLQHMASETTVNINEISGIFISGLKLRQYSMHCRFISYFWSNIAPSGVSVVLQLQPQYVDTYQQQQNKT